MLIKNCIFNFVSKLILTYKNNFNFFVYFYLKKAYKFVIFLKKYNFIWCFFIKNNCFFIFFKSKKLFLKKVVLKFFTKPSAFFYVNKKNLISNCVYSTTHGLFLSSTLVLKRFGGLCLFKYG